MPVYNVLNYVLGSFHQGNWRFGLTGGWQCACNSLFAIFWSKVRDISSWTKHDLDLILTEGDRVYKSLNTTDYLSADDLPLYLQFREVHKNINYSVLTMSIEIP